MFLDKNKNAGLLIQILIDEKQTKLKNLIEIINKSFDFCLATTSGFLQKQENISNEIILKLQTNTYFIEEIWSHNMCKCVDAAPVLSNPISMNNEQNCFK